MADPYELYLIRHGIAEQRGDSWPDDTKRPLSEGGVARLRKGTRSLAHIDVSFDVMLTSPLVRTRQTAEIIAAGLDPHPSIVTVDSLAPDGTYAAIVGDLEKHTRKKRIALVGHEPGIGELAARLIGSRHAIEFKKGAVCRIDVNALPPGGSGALIWFLTPRLMRALKR